MERIVIDDAVCAPRPDSAAMALTAEDLSNGPSCPRVAEAQVTAWRQAYRAFGVNPRRARR